MQELRKIVNDGYNKFKAYEQGKEALSVLDSLDQAKSDKTREIADLNKKHDKLFAETAKIEKQLNDAQALADAKIGDAEAKAASILANAEKAVKEAQAAADNKLAQIENKIASKETIFVSSTEKAAAALAKLNEINAELEKATNRFKNLVGA